MSFGSASSVFAKPNNTKQYTKHMIFFGVFSIEDPRNMQIKHQCIGPITFLGDLAKEVASKATATPEVRWTNGEKKPPMNYGFI